MAQRLADLNINIDPSAAWPTPGHRAELHSVSQEQPDIDEALTKAMADIAARTKVDIAVQRTGLSRRAMARVFDVDSTSSRAKSSKCSPPERAGEEVRQVTERHARRTDFAEFLRERVAC